MERKTRIGVPDPHGNASAAARHLRAHHKRFANRLGAKRPAWGWAIEQLALVGITHSGGRDPKPLTEEAVRKMWRRIQADMDAETRAAMVEARVRRREPAVRSATTRDWKPSEIRQKSEDDYLAAFGRDLAQRSGRRGG